MFWIAGRIAALISPADMLSTRFIRRLWRSVPSKAEVKPMCASGYPPRLDPKTLPFYVPPRDPGAPLLLAPQPVQPVPAKPTGPRPGWADG